MNSPPEVANAFAMNDADFGDAPAATLLKIGRHNLLHFPRTKRMEVQHAFNGYFHRFRRIGFKRVVRHGNSFNGQPAARKSLIVKETFRWLLLDDVTMIDP